MAETRVPAALLPIEPPAIQQTAPPAPAVAPEERPVRRIQKQRLLTVDLIRTNLIFGSETLAPLALGNLKSSHVGRLPDLGPTESPLRRHIAREDLPKRKLPQRARGNDALIGVEQGVRVILRPGPPGLGLIGPRLVTDMIAELGVHRDLTVEVHGKGSAEALRKATLKALHRDPVIRRFLKARPRETRPLIAPTPHWLAAAGKSYERG